MSKENARDIINKIKSLPPKQQRALIQMLKKKGVDLSSLETIPRRPEQGSEAALSFAQQRLWFLAKLDGTSSYYNIPMALRLRGRLNRDALMATLRAIVQRHEVLRTGFVERDGIAHQRISDGAGFAVSEEALEPGDDLRAICGAEAVAPFDLESESLIRMRLLRQSEDEHILLVTMHHCVSDGWSLGVFFREMIALYDAFCHGKPSPLEELPIQYSDYAHWQRQWLVDDVQERQLRYWKQKLQGINPQLVLPADRPRPAAKTYNGAHEHFRCSLELLQALRALSKQQEATLYMTLLTAYAVLIHRYSRQTDMAIGTPIANRNRFEVESLVGFFVNMLAIRADVSRDPSFNELLARIKATALEAYSHQDIPFEAVVDALQLERSLSYSPIFQVVFVLQEAQSERDVRLGDLHVSLVDFDFDITKFDLTLDLRETPDGLLGSVEYNTDSFDRSTIQRFVAHYTNLLEAIVRAPATKVSQLELLSAEERTTLLETWNPCAAPYPDRRCMHELFEARAARMPDRTAVIFEDQRLTYRELNEKANRLAHHLRARGVGPDVLVGLCVERSLDMVIGILGIVKAGGAYVPIDPSYPTDRIRYMLEDSKTNLLVTQSDLSGLPTADQTLVYLDRALDDGEGFQANLAPEAIGLAPDHLLYVIYTSGSTGRPKGVLVQHDNVTRLFHSTEDKFRFDESDVWTLFHSFAFDFSVWELWGALIYGGSLVVVPKHVAKSPVDFYRLLLDEKVTVLNQTPSAFERLVDVDRQERGEPSLRYVIFGGEALNPTILRPWFARHDDETVRMINMYGITETTVHVTYERVLQHHAGAGARSLIGAKLPDLTLYVLDERLSPVPIGVAGEVYVGGAGVARGYLHRPELTEARFLASPFGDGRRLYKTGDLARWLGDGNLEFIGRADNQIKIRGFRIEIGEIESQLSRCEGVQSCLVLLREDQPGNKQLVAYVVLDGPRDGAHQALSKALQVVLPDYMVPSAYVTLDEMPLTSNGKIDRAALPAPDSAAYAFDEYVAPRTESERALVSIWAELLGFEEGRISTRDNFFSLGGHSLMITVLVARLKERGFHTTVRSVFNTGTLAELAVELDAGRGQKVFAAPTNGIPENCTEITPAMLPLVEVSAERIAAIVATVPGGASNVQDIYPLVPSQEGILFHHLMDPSNDPYIIPVLLSAPDEATFERFVGALQSVIDRHDALRTAVVASGSAEPVQVVHRRAVLPVETITFDAHRDGEVQARALLEQPRTMPLDRAPLLHVKVARDPGSERRFLLLSMHHLIEDATSLRLIFEEIFQIMTGRPDLLGSVPSYREFVAHTLHQIQTNDAGKFFRERFGDVSEPTIPFRLANVHGDGRTIRDLRRSLPSSLAESVRRQARELRISPASLFHAAWARVVSVCSGRDDVVVGTVLSGRLQGVAGVERMLGNFINTLPLRVPLKDKCVKQLVLDTDAALKELIQYEQSSLVLAQASSGLAPGLPLFSAMINFRHFEPGAQKGLTLDDVGMSWLASIDRTNYPLGISIDDVGTEFSLNVQVDASLSPEDVMAYMHTAVAGILDGLLAEDAGGARAMDIGILPDDMRRVVSQEWNRTATPYSRDRCLFHLFEAEVARAPHAVAVVFGEQSWTYAQLNERANRIARYLHESGVGPDVRVALCTERSLEMVAGILGILKAGGAYVPIDPAYPSERIAYILESAGASILLTQSHLSVTLATGTVVHLDTGERTSDRADVLSRQSVENLPEGAVALGPNHLAYVIFTSGSTGRPKGVLVEQRGVVRLVQSPDYCPGSERTVMLQHSSISFDVGSQEVLGPLLNGGRLVLHDGDSRDVVQLMGTIAKAGVNTLCLSAAFLPAFALAAENEALPLTYMAVGGEAFSARDVLRLYRGHPDLTVINAYGPTENSIASTCYVIPRDIVEEAPIPIGRPIAQSTVYVVDANLALVPPGVVGELCVGGDGVARGYLNDEALTRAKFVRDPFGGEETRRLYRTGDLVRWLPEGQLEFVGRIDNQVKVRGFRVELGEIEDALLANPSVKSAVVSVMSGDGGSKLLAHVSPTGAYLDAVSKELNAESVQQWTRLFEDQYGDASSPQDASDSNLIGWNSSYSGDAIDEEQMHEWISGTVRKILDLRPKRLLEIGCGTGLLLFRYAAACESVHAMDISAAALAGIRRTADERRWNHVHLAQGDALSLESLEGKTFDTVVLNSVVQYFPNRLYLESVLEKLLPHVEDGGTILLGDVRNLDLLAPHLCAIERSRVPARTSAAALAKRVQRRLPRETELLVSPSFFAALGERIPEIGRVDILTKRGLGDNEMLSYRYDVMLTKAGATASRDEVPPCPWFEVETLAEVRAHLERRSLTQFAVTGLVNPRIEEDVTLSEAVEARAATYVVEPVSQASRWSPRAAEHVRELEALFRYAEELGYRGEGTWSQDRLQGLDLVFSRGPLPPVRARAPYRRSHLANHPQMARAGQPLAKLLKEHLARRVPEYMVPSHFVVLESLPLTTNGKVDKSALPPPDEADLQKEAYVAPRTETERALCGLVGEVLHLERVGAQDNFFDLGGHSLLATRLTMRIKQECAKDLPLRAIFDGATVERMAAFLDQASPEEAVPLLSMDLSGETPREIPISLQQEELWFLNRIPHLGSAYDNVQIAYRVFGKLNRRAYIDSFGDLVARHAVLRTSYIERDGVVLQQVNGTDGFAVIAEQLRDERDLDAFLAAEHDRPFDPRDRFMIRVHLLVFSESDHVVVVTRPWGIFDGSSTGRLFAELSQLYRARSRDGEAKLEPAAIQYADFAHWQRRNKAAVLERQRAYWSRQLDGLPAQLGLRTDYRRPPVKSYRGASIPLAISADLHARLVRVSQQHEATLYMTLLSAFSMLLRMHTAESDMAIGSPVTDRPRSEFQQLVGYFVNVVVLRTKVTPHARFTDVLAQTKRASMDARENADLPFKEVVRACAPEPDPAYSPLFQAMFNLVHASGSDDGAGPTDLSIRPIRTEAKIAKFDLNMVLQETASGLQGYLEYSTDLYRRASAEEMLACYERLLQAIVAQPTATLSQLHATTKNGAHTAIEPSQLYPGAP